MEHTTILISLRKILRSVNIESKRIEKEHGLSVPQYLCLAFLVKQPGYKATLKEVKEHLVLNASTVTGIVARLERKGFALKMPNHGDKRSVHIVLTAIGKESIEAIPMLFHEKLTTKLQNLPQNELLELQHSLDLIVKIMEVEDIDASPMIMQNQKIGK